MTTAVADNILKIARVNRVHKDLFGIEGQSFQSFIEKISAGAIESDLRRNPGQQAHPFDFLVTINLKTHNPHHSTCIEAKANSICGLGHSDITMEQIKILDGLCENSWIDLISDVVEDYVQVGNSFIEVVRDGADIVALYHVPAPNCKVFVLNDSNAIIYEVTPEDGMPKRFRKFGISEDDYIGEDLDAYEISKPDSGFESEIIHLKKPTSSSLYYGVPNWLGGIPSIELAQCLHQYNYDFFLNRGVPEFLLLLMGAQIPVDDWKKIEELMKSNVGLGNSHKSQVFNLSQELNVELLKLGMDSGKDDTFSKVSETLGLEIVSAHQVPPLLAGIQIPGKIGAANELPNALMAFQLLVIRKDQNIITGALDCTLGDDPSFPINRGEFGFKTIIEEIAEAQQVLKPIDTMSRMRETLPEAAAEGRNLNEGLKE
jgi:hypothetical protein|tara:strand:- start:13940 stop:15229 length:1290 start_codon:yes stop_codon:yes gene_type:complete